MKRAAHAPDRSHGERVRTARVRAFVRRQHHARVASLGVAPRVVLDERVAHAVDLRRQRFLQLARRLRLTCAGRVRAMRPTHRRRRRSLHRRPVSRRVVLLGLRSSGVAKCQWVKGWSEGVPPSQCEAPLPPPLSLSLSPRRAATPHAPGAASAGSGAWTQPACRRRSR